MLCCIRKPGESIAIPASDITFEVMSVGAISAKIRISAPRKFSIDREGLKKPRPIENDPTIGHVVIRRKAGETVSVCKDFVLLIERIKWSDLHMTYVTEVQVDTPADTDVILRDALNEERLSENDPQRSPYSHLPKWARPSR